MTKWEYTFLYGSTSGRLIEKYGHPAAHEDKNIWELSNDLGKDGWELINVAKSEDRIILAFKREAN